MYDKKLQKIRRTLKLSQEEISSQIGISYRAYTSYERGDRKPSLDFLGKLVEKFGINLNWLIANKGEMFNSKPQDIEQTKEAILSEVRKMLKDEGVVK